MLRQGFLAAGLVLLALAAFLFLGQQTPSYQNCQSDYQAQHANNAQRDHEYVVGLLMKCEGVAIDANNGTIITLTTSAEMWPYTKAVRTRASIQVTFDTYGHLWKTTEDDLKAMAQIEARLLA